MFFSSSISTFNPVGLVWGLAVECNCAVSCLNQARLRLYAHVDLLLEGTTAALGHYQGAAESSYQGGFLFCWCLLGESGLQRTEDEIGTDL